MGYGNKSNKVLHVDMTGEVDSRFQDANNKIDVVLGTGVYGERFPKLSNETSDSPRISRAVQYAIDNRITEINLSNDVYEIDSTISYTFDVKMKGNGWGANGTTFKRTANVVGFQIEGESVANLDPEGHSGKHVANFPFEEVEFDGGDFTEDFIRFYNATFVRMKHCKATACKGRFIHGWELFDSRFNDCFFAWIGNVDGTLPGIELESGGGKEYTNQIHFDNCDFENYRGVAVAGTGTNTNEIFFTTCKFESHISPTNHVYFENSNYVSFDECTFTFGAKDPALTVPEIMKFVNCTKVFVKGWFEQTGSIGTEVAYLDNFVKFIGCKNIKFFGSFNQNGVDNLIDSVCVKADTWDSKNTIIEGFIDGSNPNNKKITNVDTRTLGYRSEILQGPDANTTYINNDVNPNDKWYIGRVVADGDGTKFRLLRNKNGVVSEIFRVANNNDVVFSSKIKVENTFYVPVSTSAPYANSVHVPIWFDSDTGNLKTVINGSEKTIQVT
ncbi:hypothetical protein [Halobacillus sp. BBL2006]|uniref:hypothetical protein n=1 Tax=Halobacillus sp. BBL2006 TaxID=1543706 RepID=UPI00054354CF|nr:hypothetical protein [Halobacillus sp. BBL2006]KHE73148.1 hypothetical protein LD39_00720 [Halobacillus sp. BBL2006]